MNQQAYSQALAGENVVALFSARARRLMCGPTIREMGRFMASGQQHRKVSLIEKFAELTGWSDGDIAVLMTISATEKLARSTVQAYRTHTLPEALTEAQKAKLLDAARAYRQQVYEQVAEMELYS